ncbi:hypothetical protein [Vibrio sp. 10N.261.46.A3]|uniref:hypothetical protein n=1 Tax=Vibrio sp. 10N.261.46.A3 TaxID=3229658 RepID=UPI003551D849
MLVKDKEQAELVDRIIRTASRFPMTPDYIIPNGHSACHIAFVCEQLAFWGYLCKLDTGEYIRA